MQFCDQTCSHCARDWFRWLKSREGQMRHAQGNMTTSFAAAAATSVRPPRLSAGTKVRVVTLPYNHTAFVKLNTQSAGGDGRHWVQVEVSTPGGAPWLVHVEAGDLQEAEHHGHVAPR